MPGCARPSPPPAGSPGAGLRRFLASKEQFHAYLRARGQPGPGEEEEEGEGRKEEAEEEEAEVEEEVSEPPAKRERPEEHGQDGESREEAGAAAKAPAERRRVRGQNKSRPCMKPTCYEQSRLCPSVTQVGAGPCPSVTRVGAGSCPPPGRGVQGPGGFCAPGLRLFVSLGRLMEARAAAGRVQQGGRSRGNTALLGGRS